MNTVIVGTLDPEDLAIWRLQQARAHAIQQKPGAFNASEIEQVYLTGARLTGDFCARYGIDDSRAWIVSASTGLIYYTD